MTMLPGAGIGEEVDARGLLARARRMVGDKMSYALADQVAYSFGNLVVMALLSRHASGRELGMYILTQRAMDVLIQLSNVMLWGPFVFNLPGMEKMRQKTYIGSVLSHQIVACAIGAVLLFGAARWAATPERGLYYGVFEPLIFTSIGILFREYTRRMYFAEMRMKEAFWTDLVTVALQIGGVEYLYRTSRLDVRHTLWVLSAGAIVVNLWWIVREWSTFKIDWRTSREDMRLNVKLGRWFLGSNMVFTVSSQCNPWVLSRMLGGVAVGDYAVCESVVNIPRVALVSLQNIMAPMMARAHANGGKPELKKLVKRLDRTLLAGSALFAAGILVAGPWVAHVIFKKNVPQARFILAMLAMNLVAYAATMAQAYGLTAIDRAAYTFYANTAGLVAQVAVCVWLIHWLQIPGAAAAMLVGSLVVMLVRQFYYSREMRPA